jgi:hypothetical protein
MNGSKNDLGRQDDRKEMASTASRALTTAAKLVRCLWAAKLVVWALLPRVAHSLRTGN